MTKSAVLFFGLMALSVTALRSCPKAEEGIARPSEKGIKWLSLTDAIVDEKYQHLPEQDAQYKASLDIMNENADPELSRLSAAGYLFFAVGGQLDKIEICEEEGVAMRDYSREVAEAFEPEFMLSRELIAAAITQFAADREASERMYSVRASLVEKSERAGVSLRELCADMEDNAPHVFAAIDWPENLLLAQRILRVEDPTE